MSLFRLIISLLLFAAPLGLHGVPGDTSSISAHRLHNCEVEISMIKKNLDSQEAAREAIEKDLRQVMRAVKESSLEYAEEALKKSRNVEKQLEKAISDIKEIKQQFNALSQDVAELAKKIARTEEETEHNTAAINSLEKAMRALTKAMKGSKAPSSRQSDEQYVVQSGDSLEKIAKIHKISLRELKEYNNLSSDTIRQGQKLSIPQSSS